MSIARIDPGDHFAAAVTAQGHLHISGTIARSIAASIETRIREVLERIDELLAKADTSKSNLLSVSVHLPHIRDYEAMKRVRDQWVDPDNKPARVTVEARLANETLPVKMAAAALVI